MSDLLSDLKNTSFIKSPTNAVVDLSEQYLHDVADIVDRHAVLVSRKTKKKSVGWLSETY